MSRPAFRKRVRGSNPGTVSGLPRRVAYFRVSDPDYPRNALIRRSLQNDSRFDLVTVARSRGASRLSNSFHDYRRLWAVAQKGGIVVLSEFANSHAFLAWVVAMARRSSLVVDGFIGLYETAVEDHHQFGVRDPRAVRLRLLDWLAFRLPRLYLVDNSLRGKTVSQRYSSSRTVVIAVPVGAPDWAVWSAPAPEGARFRILYYGNYIPLHGLPRVLESLPRLQVDWSLRLIGEGGGRAQAETLVRQLGISDRVEFIEPVRPEILIRHIHESDLVLGVFGDSPKARSVVANKVWQGLAAGRAVLTRRNDATDELTEIAGGQLVTIDSVAPAEISRAIDEIATRENREYDSAINRKLDAFVSRATKELADRLAREDEV